MIDDLPLPVLLIGKGGMLGQAWDRLLTRLGVPFESPGIDRLDLTAPRTIRTVLTARYRLVVNAAAYTDVDRCETEEELARAVNGIGVGDLAARCVATGAQLVHFSTDHVFDGTASTPYRTDDPRCPINAYGRTKALGEELVEAAGSNHLIVRSSWLYAPWGENFVRTIARLVQQRDAFRVVDDQRGRPTSAQQLAENTWLLLEKGARGIYHVTDDGDCTWYELARSIHSYLPTACEITPCSTAEYPRAASRPAYSVLDLSKTFAVLGTIPHWTENLERTLQQLTFDRE
jgi:dTDP-4-dehydrorhamnose reductase